MLRCVVPVRAAVKGIVIILVAFLAGGCVSPREIRKEFEPYSICPGDRYHLFVATEDTTWKHDVVDHLAEDLGDQYCLSVQNLAALGTASVGQWDAVVVLTTIYAFGLQSDTAGFLERAEQKERIVLLVTSSISDLKEYGVDAVSAASTGNVGEDARSLTPRRQPDDVAAELARLVRLRVE